jgi:rod shape-determining protein MreC
MRKLTRRQQVGAAALTFCALLFISLDFTAGSLASAHSGARGALGGLYRGTDSVIGPVRRFVQGVPDVAGNRAKIAELTQQNDELRRKLADAQLNAGTAKRLNDLQLQADSGGWQILPTRVIATGPGAGFQWTVTVDVGSREQVLLGQTVTDGFGLVGRVVEVHQATSVILLAADPTAGVGVRDTRSGELLLATGNGSRGITAVPIDDNVDIKVGDHLVTGPAGKTTFVNGIEVGVVTKVSRSLAGRITATVRPSAPQAGLDLIGVVLQQPRDTARQPLTPGNAR